MPWKFASARWIAASAMPSSSATAIAASELQHVVQPGQVHGDREAAAAARAHDVEVGLQRRRGRMFTARRSAPAAKP